MSTRLEALLADLIAKSRSHGVDPGIFVLLYFASIPPYLASMAWLVRRRVRREPILLPLGATLGFFILPSAYVALFGRRLPLWIYGLLGSMLAAGSVSAVRRVRGRLADLALDGDETG
ncbi:MAG: hypothetical protein H6648_01140 [Caldilineae bacterium]|nr:hypothetical protein [Chloroflexota bacterium]MCB9175735.1 hypothetical protein [Caldilineae bacterium]